MPKFTRATRTQNIRVHDIFRNQAFLFVDGEATDFNDGWTDERIAEMVGCPVSSVRAARTEDFGLKHPRYGKPFIERRASRIDVVEKRVDELEDTIAYLASQAGIKLRAA